VTHPCHGPQKTAHPDEATPVAGEMAEDGNPIERNVYLSTNVKLAEETRFAPFGTLGFQVRFGLSNGTSGIRANTQSRRPAYGHQIVGNLRQNPPHARAAED
jgi:hypothetical protein